MTIIMNSRMRQFGFFSIVAWLQLTVSCMSREYLDNIPVTFQLQGEVAYIPTSGGDPIPGYKLRIGYNKHSWIGIQMMALTSESKYDILIATRSNTTTADFYKTTLKDYFVAEGRDKLTLDSVNYLDRQATSYSMSNAFELDIIRPKGITSGEDWEGGQFLKVCFFTSAAVFSTTDWKGTNSSCYGYQISNYESTFRGIEIGNMKVDDSNFQVYGGVDDSYLKMQLHWYRVGNLQDGELALRLGNKISDLVGYDYHLCILNPGDYYGHTINNLKKDLLYSGYDDGHCTVTKSTTSTQINFQRYVYTDDGFDVVIHSKMEICLIMKSENCQQIALELLYPIMTAQSVVTLGGFTLFGQFTLLLIFIVLQ